MRADLPSPALVGAAGVIGALTLNEVAALAVALVSIATMLPLLVWRWRALLRGEKRPDNRE